MALDYRRHALTIKLKIKADMTDQVAMHFRIAPHCNTVLVTECSMSHDTLCVHC